MARDGCGTLVEHTERIEDRTLSKHEHGQHRHERRDRHEHGGREHGPRPQAAAALNQRHILESFIGAFSALMIVVLILAPLVGARRERRRF
jgi:hypothetical protein